MVIGPAGGKVRDRVVLAPPGSSKEHIALKQEGTKDRAPRVLADIRGSTSAPGMTVYLKE